jgi:uncharacterized protein (DUF1697 family)
MSRYLALLRAINLAGHNKVRMDDLRKETEGLGLTDVSSYLQSGNILFTDPDSKRRTLSRRIQAVLEERYAVRGSSVIIKDRQEMLEIIAANPFLAQADCDTAKLHVTFLSAEPSEPAGSIEKHGGDSWCRVGSIVYICCENGYGRSKLTNNYFETQLHVLATTRNWRSVTTLAAML